MGRSRKLDEKRRRGTDSREGRERKDGRPFSRRDNIHVKSRGVRSSVSFNRVIGLCASNGTRIESTKSRDSFDMVTLLGKGWGLNGRWNRSLCLNLKFEMSSFFRAIFLRPTNDIARICFAMCRDKIYSSYDVVCLLERKLRLVDEIFAADIK